MLPNVAKCTFADSILVVSTDKMIPLKKFAEANQIGYRTAYRHWQNGLLEGVKLPTGTILIKGWKSDDAVIINNNNKCVIFIRSIHENNTETLNYLKHKAIEHGLYPEEIIIWQGYAFQENPFIEKIINSNVKTIVTTKLSDICGSNWRGMSLILAKLGIVIIATEESQNIENSIKGLIQASSRMAKTSVGMHNFKKDIAHYTNNLLN